MPNDPSPTGRQSRERQLHITLTVIFCLAALSFFVAALAAGLGTPPSTFALVLMVLPLCLAVGWWMSWPKLAAKGAQRGGAEHTEDDHGESRHGVRTVRLALYCVVGVTALVIGQWCYQGAPFTPIRVTAYMLCGALVCLCMWLGYRESQPTAVTAPAASCSTTICRRQTSWLAGAHPPPHALMRNNCADHRHQLANALSCRGPLEQRPRSVRLVDPHPYPDTARPGPHP